MKKVLHLFKEFYPDMGGIQTAMMSVAKLLPEYEHTVLSARREPLGEYEIDGIKVINVKSYGDVLSLPMSPAYVMKTLTIMNRYDIVCVHYPFPLAEVALAVKGHKNVVYFWHSEIVAQKRARRLVDPFTRACLKRAKRIFISYPQMAERSPLLNVHQEKAVLCPYSFEKVEAEIKPEFITDDIEANFALCVGRLVPYKGYNYLIDAMVKVPELKVVIAGGGGLKDQLENQITANGLEDRVFIVSGLKDEELEYLRNRSRFFLFPSCMQSEAFGIAQIEAMSCGRAVVNCEVETGVNWVARDGKEALTAKHSDIDDLADKMNKLLDDAELLSELSANAKDRVEKLFTVSEHRKNLLSGFEGL